MATVKGSRRQESARATRRAVLVAASELFVAEGWAATTIDAIAERADVSRPTVFAVGGKVALLTLARDLAMAGDDEELAVSQRESAQRVLAATDPSSWLTAWAEHVTGVQERYGPLDAVLHRAAGADPGLAALWRTSEQQRRRGAELFTRDLAGKAVLAEPVERATDVVWLLMAPDTHTRLVVDREWTRSAYVQWLAASAGALLLSR